VEHATSADGTRIAYEQSGSGRPLVLCHGTSVERFSFRFLEPLLTDRFTLYAVDRRGRGESGDSTDDYAIEQEFADIAALVDSLAQPTDLFGHSYGATVALGAAPLARNLRRLVLYEPAPGVPQVDPNLLARLDALLAEGEREQLLSDFLTEVGLDPDALEQLRASPLWKLRVAAAHTIPRELLAEGEAEAAGLSALGRVRQPVLQVLGGDSLPAFAESTEALDAHLTDGRVIVIPGARHAAHHTHPDAFVDAVRAFLSEA
jgi:pimeloyl-ACP methyl ester carboxylesterase